MNYPEGTFTTEKQQNEAMSGHLHLPSYHFNWGIIYTTLLLEIQCVNIFVSFFQVIHQSDSGACLPPSQEALEKAISHPGRADLSWFAQWTLVFLYVTNHTTYLPAESGRGINSDHSICLLHRTSSTTLTCVVQIRIHSVIKSLLTFSSNVTYFHCY